MKFFVYLMTLLFVGTAIAQNPTILQGSYISNVFGNSNFVLNPNAQTNVANVTNATRSTTTPLVATSEFTLSLASGANATWTLRAFDGGMKGQNCEARFTYRGFATATTKAEIVQNSLVVASLTLTPTTDPRIASINFPCGDLANLTTFRIAQTTANMTGTNEIGGIYVGLATNMANVAQAENVVLAGRSTTQTIANNTQTTIDYATETLDVYGEYTSGVFTAKRAGNYVFDAMFLFNNASWTANQLYEISAFKNGSQSCTNNQNVQATISTYIGTSVSCGFALVVGDTIEIKVRHQRGANTDILGDVIYTRLQVKRFPSSSELVVTPERQNVFGEISGTGTDTTTTSTSYVTPSGFSPIYSTGRCTNDGTNLACKISTLPPGTYKVDVSLPYFAVAGGSGGQNCWLQVTDNKGAIDAPTAQASSNTSQNDGISSVSRTFTYNSIQTDVIFTVKHKQVGGGAGGSCGIYTSGGKYFTMAVTPLNPPTNSALYVQGPVLGAQTGAAIPASYVGEKLDFTARTISGVTTGYTANSGGKLATLTPGVWLIFAQVSSGGGAGLTGYGAFIATGTNNADDQWITGTSANTTFVNDVNFGSSTQMVVVTYNATTSTDIYAKAKTYGASQTITIRGYAVRIN